MTIPERETKIAMTDRPFSGARGALAGASRRWFRDKRGSVATFFGLAAIPAMAFVGVALDYSRASSVRSQLQTALDSSLISAASRNYSTDVAASTFQAAAKLTVADPGAISYAKSNGALTGTIAGDNVFSLNVTYTSNSDGSLSGAATANVPTVFLALIRLTSVPVTARATVSGNFGAETDCLITLGNGAASTSNSLTLNGAPVVNLSGCSMRSNTSMVCNGHNGNAKSSIAVGAATACSNPRANQPAIGDPYYNLASNITTKCGGNVSGVSWTAGSSIPSAMIPVTRSGYAEYHVCGDLNLSGSGTLTGSNPSTDTVFVIENGSVNVANNAVVTANGSTFVFTGSNVYNHTINFPNGKGQVATWNIEPSTSSSNPWQGVALYQDPNISANVDVKINQDQYSDVDVGWGPGGQLNVDGVAYLPHANVVISGNAGSGNTPCTVFVTGTFTTNGAVNLNFSQNQDNCKKLGVTQYTQPARLIQ
jgi:Flp pilus assembly protein TadG